MACATVTRGYAGAPMPSTISVALVTRNRPDSLERTLRSLRAQQTQPLEVVVSDDSDPDQADETRRMAEEHGCRYERGPRRGLYANRNAVARACRGSHIRTMDDDHEFPPGHWEACESAVARDAEAVWVIGEIEPGGDPAEPRFPGELHPRGFSTMPRDLDRTWAISDGASIYPASIFASGLLFSEAFKFGASYLEFGSRLHHLGYRIRHMGDTWVIHHFDPATRSFASHEEDLGSKVFATLSHSFTYQPSVRNRLLTVAELARDVAKHPRVGGRAARRGYRAYREQRDALSTAAR